MYILKISGLRLNIFNCQLLQNIQNPKKWEYKLYVFTSPEGQIFNFRIHTLTIERCEDQPDLQVSGYFVMHLMSKITRNNWDKFFIDNWYTGVPLGSTLM